MAGRVIDRIGDIAMNAEQPRIEYVEARRALLDALTALQSHVDAFVLIGAQAVYLRTAGPPARLPAVHHRCRPRARPKSPCRIVPVDLIVPAHVASSAGRQGARLPGDRGRTAARKSAGHSRRLIVNVGGPATLLVAKVHKLGERLATPHRLIDKDAGDVFRLIEATPLREMTHLMQMLLADERSAAAATVAIGYVRQLFATPRSPGVQLAAKPSPSLPTKRP